MGSEQGSNDGTGPARGCFSNYLQRLQFRLDREPVPGFDFDRADALGDKSVQTLERRSDELVFARVAGRPHGGKYAAAFAAIELRLPDGWLNNSVGSFTPEAEKEEFFVLFGDYPKGEKSGLRVCLAKPEYLIAMKLKALVRDSYDDKDFNDIVGLAVEAKIETPAQLNDLFVNIHKSNYLAWCPRSQTTSSLPQWKPGA